ncbi:hypothetical protein ACFLXU_06970 [Chloroflexota bacterium]
MSQVVEADCFQATPDDKFRPGAGYRVGPNRCILDVATEHQVAIGQCQTSKCQC